MKTTLLILCAAVLLLATNSAVLAQGSLTPPGPPSPTMKTLDQVEPRRPISSLPTGLSSGSYYLTTNLTLGFAGDGIGIFDNNVTIDLNGFTMTGQPGIGSGVFMGGITNVTIRNGTLRNWGNNGINAVFARYCRFIDVVVIGTGGAAIVGGANARVENCSAIECGGGIIVTESSRIVGSLSVSKAGTGFGGSYSAMEIEKCIARNNSGDGIVVGNVGRVKDSVAEGNSTGGISTGDGAVVEGCTVGNSPGNGFYFGKSCRIANCAAISNANFAFTLGDGGQAQGCIVSYGARGFDVGINTVLQDCSAIANGADGVYAPNGSCDVINCNIRSNTSYGIELSGPGRVSNCVIEQNRNGGILAANYAVLMNNTVRSNGAAAGFGGITITGRGGRIEGNICIGNTGQGISANSPASTNNLIIHNSATANSGGNFVFNSTNHFVNVSSSNLATNTNPHVNFSH